MFVQTLSANVKGKMFLLLDSFNLKKLDFKKNLQKYFKGTQTARNNFINPGLQINAPLISAAVAAKTKNHQMAQTTSNFLKNILEGRILSLTDMQDDGLRLRVM